MLAATKFLFDRRFGEDDLPGDTAVGAEGPDAPAGAEAEVEAQPTFTAEDLERVRQETLAFARKQAEAQTARQVEAAEDRIATLLGTISSQMNDLLQCHRDAEAAHARYAAQVAAAAVRKLFPTLNERGGADEVVDLVDTVMARLIETPKLTVRVSPGLREAIAERIEAMAETQAFAGHLSVSADETIADGDCRLIWTGGGAERNAEAIFAAIDGAIDRTVGPAETATASETTEQATAETIAHPTSTPTTRTETAGASTSR